VCLYLAACSEHSGEEKAGDEAARRLRGERIFGELDAGAPRSIPVLGSRGEASLSTAAGFDAHLTIMAARSFPTAVSRTPVGKEHAAARPRNTSWVPPTSG